MKSQLQAGNRNLQRSDRLLVRASASGGDDLQYPERVARIDGRRGVAAQRVAHALVEGEVVAGCGRDLALALRADEPADGPVAEARVARPRAAPQRVFLRVELGE